MDVLPFPTTREIVAAFLPRINRKDLVLRCALTALGGLGTFFATKGHKTSTFLATLLTALLSFELPQFFIDLPAGETISIGGIQDIRFTGVLGDGNCFYHCLIAAGVDGSIKELRARAADQMAATLAAERCTAVGCPEGCQDVWHKPTAAQIGYAINEHNTAMQQRAKGQVSMEIFEKIPLAQLKLNCAGDKFTDCKSKEDYLKALRADEEEPQRIAPGSIEEENIEAFIQAYRAHEGDYKVYAGTPDIIALATALNRRIWVVQQHPNPNPTTIQPFGEEGDGDEIFVIKMRGEDHFNLLRPTPDQAAQIKELPLRKQ